MLLEVLQSRYPADRSGILLRRQSKLEIPLYLHNTSNFPIFLLLEQPKISDKTPIQEKNGHPVDSGFEAKHG
ncbi:MAG TPA: hypothetical protein VK462_04990 [Nitrososphaeraceae archaeon]|nr:hypothetical protein [Nitrososphaeraceae archaeon]